LGQLKGKDIPLLSQVILKEKQTHALVSISVSDRDPDPKDL
jgi:hypothetical protein